MEERTENSYGKHVISYSGLWHCQGILQGFLSIWRRHPPCSFFPSVTKGKHSLQSWWESLLPTSHYFLHFLYYSLSNHTLSEHTAPSQTSALSTFKRPCLSYLKRKIKLDSSFDTVSYVYRLTLFPHFITKSCKNSSRAFSVFPPCVLCG